MRRAVNVSFRRLSVSAAVAFWILTVACEPEPFSPGSTASLARPVFIQIPRARVIEPGDRWIPNLPGGDAWSSAGVADPVNRTFDAAASRGWILESLTTQLIEIAAGPDGRVDRLKMKRIDARSFGLRNPQGLTVDPASGRLFVLDAGPRIVRLEPHPYLGFQSPIISAIDLTSAGLTQVRGIAFDPTSGHLHVLDPQAQAIHEVTQTGRIVATRDVSELGLHNPQGMAIGPTGDATDDSSEVSLYIAAGGHVTELSLALPVATPLATTVTGTLVRTTQTSQYSPPSPDPSGITYATHLGRLVIVDGEVNEMPIYAGANVFETTPSGGLFGTWATLSFSNEPVGTAYNPANRHLYISDDDDRRVYEVNPGPDGRYGTGDDSRTSFATAPYGNSDPEGLAYDAANGALFIADGVNAQVYRVTPGANGVFDGVSPSGDDQVTSFDTQVLGLLDPEGIAYDSDFGHLYVVGKPSSLVFQLSTTGELLGTIDISAADADKPAGLEYVSGAGTRALYIVDRGVDNDAQPTENDGKLYEFSLPPLSGNTLPSVTITAPPNGSIFTQGSAITFTGTASDLQDGNLTASLAWSSSRDGTLGSGGSVSTSTLSVGTHTITASVTDGGGAQASATIAVTVNAPGSGTLVVRVSAGVDDAEEAATGAVSVTNGDLELVLDGTLQTVGLRFNAVTIPPGATITGASVQFQTDEAKSEATSLTITGQAADNAAAFSTALGNISSRPRTVSAVAWAPVPWTTVGQAGPNQQTPSIASIVQEIINRPGWRSGNSLAIIVTGTGRRTAESFEGLPAAAPLLRIDYSTGPDVAPTATNVTISGTVAVGQPLTGNYTYTDANGDAEGTSTYRWLRDGAPISGATSRSYTLLVADQGTLIVFEVTPVAAAGVSPGAPVQSPTVGPVAAPPPNSAPIATNVTISGTVAVGRLLTGNYTYTDANGDAQGTSTYRWLRDGAPISGATSRSYTLVAADEGRLIRFEVTPVAATGASPGAPVQSPTVGPVAAAVPFVVVRVSAGVDDAEEAATGAVSVTNGDLELVLDGTLQTVGLRFNAVTIPPGATITGASVQFQTDEAKSEATSLTITGQAADNAAAFSTALGNISSRPRTVSAVAWAPVPWTIVGQAGPNQQTPSIASIVQEIINRPGWRSGNSLAIIVTGTGRRTAEAFEGLPAAAPLLSVEYSTGPNVAPTATNVTISGTVAVGQPLTGNYTYTDANADAEGTSTYRWLRDGAPIGGATARSYTLVAADQGTLIGFEVTPVAAAGVSPGAPVQSPTVGPVAAPPPNSAPIATNVAISGAVNVGQVLTGNYTYTDANGDAEGTSTYRWLRDGAPISGATSRSYTLVAADQGTLIRFEVTPVAATGSSPGAPVQGPAVGPVALAATVVTVRVAAGADDAEESATGSVNTSSSDLEMVVDGTSNQTVGMRFNAVTIPPGATITAAYVQFQVDEVSSDATSLTIRGEAADNAAVFSLSARNISLRSRTASAVAWSPAPWTIVNQAGPNQQTPSIASIVQEIVNRPGWQSGNSLAIIVTGTGRRIAEAYDGVPAAAPLLRVEYSVGSPPP